MYKKDFPIFQNIPSLNYLDSAATSQKPQLVLDAIVEFYSTYNANIHRGIYPIAEKATEKVEEVRRKVARFINAKDPSEIIFTKSTTEGINLVMNSFGKDIIAKDDVIVTTIIEHHANFVPWQVLAAEKGALFTAVDITNDGYLLEKELLEDAMSSKLLAISSVSNMLGTIIPIEKLIRKIRKKNRAIKILVDAAQEAPHKKIDVQKVDCDFLVFSGHKMLAGMGVGVLYTKKALLSDMQPVLYGGDMIREVTVKKTTFAESPAKFEAGTLDIAAIISLGAAIDYLESVGFTNIEKHERDLIAHTFNRLEKIHGLYIYGPNNLSDRSSLLSFTVDGIHPHDIAQVLADDNICVRSGHHCTMPLHKRLDINASVRASFYLYNTQEDVEKFVDSLQKVIKIFK